MYRKCYKRGYPVPGYPDTRRHTFTAGRMLPGYPAAHVYRTLSPYRVPDWNDVQLVVTDATAGRPELVF
eukprot:2096957-Rhodomonas_salina.1